MNGRQEASPKEGDERSVIELELLRDGRKRIRLRRRGQTEGGSSPPFRCAAAGGPERLHRPKGRSISDHRRDQESVDPCVIGFQKAGDSGIGGRTPAELIAHA